MLGLRFAVTCHRLLMLLCSGVSVSWAAGASGGGSAITATVRDAEVRALECWRCHRNDQLNCNDRWNWTAEKCRPTDTVCLTFMSPQGTGWYRGCGNFHDCDHYFKERFQECYACNLPFCNSVQQGVQPLLLVHQGLTRLFALVVLACVAGQISYR